MTICFSRIDNGSPPRLPAFSHETFHRELLCTLTQVTATAGHLVHGIQQLVGMRVLQQVTERAHPHGLGHIARVLGEAEQDDTGSQLAPLHLFEHLDAGVVVQPQIHDRNGWLQAGQIGHGGGGMVGFPDHPVPGTFQNRAQTIAQDGKVFDQIHIGRVACGPGQRLCGQRTAHRVAHEAVPRVDIYPLRLRHRHVPATSSNNAFQQLAPPVCGASPLAGTSHEMPADGMRRSLYLL
ncbi:hypothetical protein J2X09_000412 [Hydrogenophaga laconesensis]|uniref:Uncharacterized protein n=1 Tax=Hydrogenophaga laconesensis TaxID=1805971 RepID=A0ABU1V5H2_9BURK|nr:hypothetical protein [Hydrogenophaga laconesensis]MDR7092689.1 hypothetical protein [Hydrogenophaga laconesensis]